jgi:HD-like signal output (HDOD) protein
MNEALVGWLKQLDKMSLPVLAHSRTALERLLEDDYVPMAQLTAVIEKDMGLTLQLLRYINNIKHKHLATEVTTVGHALMMLGMNQLKELPARLVTVESLDPRLQPTLLEFYSRAHHAAYQAGQIALLRKDLEPDEVYMAALLHNVGKMILWLYRPSEMMKLYGLLKERTMEPEEAEYVVFGFSIDELTKELAKQWHLPGLFRDSLYPENAGNHRILGIMLATQLSRASQHDWYSSETTEIIQQIADLLYLEPASTAALLHRFCAEAARGSAFIKIRHAALNMISPPLAESAKIATGKSSKVTQDNRDVAAQDKPASDFCLMMQLPLVEKTIKRLASEQNLQLKDIIQMTMLAIHDGLGLNRVVFALLTSAKNELRARSIIGSGNDPIFNQFAIGLEKGNLFSIVMEKPQALWLDDHNRTKFWKLVPLGFQHRIKINSFFVMSVFIKGKPIGMFYADRHTTACKLDKKSYQLFKQLVSEATLALTRISR